MAGAGGRGWGQEEGGGAVASDLLDEKILKICFARSVKFTF